MGDLCPPFRKTERRVQVSFCTGFSPATSIQNNQYVKVVCFVMANFAPVHTPHTVNMDTQTHTHTHRCAHILFSFMVRHNKINIIATFISSLLLSPNASAELLLNTSFQRPDYQSGGKIFFYCEVEPFVSYCESKVE